MKKQSKPKRPKTKFCIELVENLESIHIWTGAVGYYSVGEIRSLIRFLEKAAFYLEARKVKS